MILIIEINTKIIARNINELKTSRHCRIITHTFVLQAEIARMQLMNFGQPLHVNDQPRDCLRVTPLYSFTHQRPNGWMGSVLAPTN